MLNYQRVAAEKNNRHRIADHFPRGFPMASPMFCRVETMNKIDIAMVPHVIHGFNTT